VRRGMTAADKERIAQFGKKVERLMLGKGWSGADLAREMERHAPKGVTIGRHIPTAYIRGENEPTQRNLMLIAKALGVKPEELIAPAPGEGGSVPQFAQATSTLDGKTRNNSRRRSALRREGYSNIDGGCAAHGVRGDERCCGCGMA
jgi:transcriptional regulator with XRE-family HTH domain